MKKFESLLVIPRKVRAQIRMNLAESPMPASADVTKMSFLEKIRFDILLLFLLTAGVYAFFGSLSDTCGNDTVTRSLMAWRWLKAPFFILASNDITWVFGPFHCYFNALVILITGNPLWGPRLSACLFGALTAIPLYMLVKHFFGRRAAFYSGLAFPFFTFFIGLSVSGNSEPISSFFILWAVYFAVRFRETHSLSWAVVAGVSFSLAGATRYDVWVFGPILIGYLTWEYIRNRSRAVLRGLIVFSIFAASFPAAWIVGNYIKIGDPFIFFRQAYGAPIISDHFDLPYVRHVLYDIALFPSVMTLGLTPAVFFIAIFGFYRTLRQKGSRGLFPAIVLLILVLSYLGVFVINQKIDAVSRMMVLHGLFILMFFGPGMVVLQSSLKQTLGKILFFSTLIIMIVFSALPPLAAFKPAEWNSRLIPLSQYVPVDRNIKLAEDFLHRRLERGEKLILDCKFMPQRSILLRLFEHENDIIQFYGTASDYAQEIISRQPDIIVLSPSNRRLSEIQSAWINSHEFHISRLNYILKYSVNDFLIFFKVETDNWGPPSLNLWCPAYTLTMYRQISPAAATTHHQCRENQKWIFSVRAGRVLRPAAAALPAKIERNPPGSCNGKGAVSQIDLSPG
jgi:hypothetical protein